MADSESKSPHWAQLVAWLVPAAALIWTIYTYSAPSTGPVRETPAAPSSFDLDRNQDPTKGQHGRQPGPKPPVLAHNGEDEAERPSPESVASDNSRLPSVEIEYEELSNRLSDLQKSVDERAQQLPTGVRLRPEIAAAFSDGRMHLAAAKAAIDIGKVDPAIDRLAKVRQAITVLTSF